MADEKRTKEQQDAINKAAHALMDRADAFTEAEVTKELNRMNEELLKKIPAIYSDANRINEG